METIRKLQEAEQCVSDPMDSGGIANSNLTDIDLQTDDCDYSIEYTSEEEDAVHLEEIMDPEQEEYTTLQLRFKDIVRALPGDELDTVDLENIRQGVWADPNVDDDDKDERIAKLIDIKRRKISIMRSRTPPTTYGMGIKD